MAKLNDEQLKLALDQLPGWAVEDGKLAKTFQFGNFRDAMSFLLRLSYEVEEANHHPEIENVYNRIRFALCTHDAGSTVTEKDTRLAQAIERLSGARS
jgi:4a-hydroxytetrahydrobiopterin dehydratase